MTVGGGAGELLTRWVMSGRWDARGGGGMSGLGATSISPRVHHFDSSLASSSARNRVHLPKFSLSRDALPSWHGDGQRGGCGEGTRCSFWEQACCSVWLGPTALKAAWQVPVSAVWRPGSLGPGMPVPALCMGAVSKDKSLLPSSKQPLTPAAGAKVYCTVCIWVPSAIAGHLLFNRSSLALWLSGCRCLRRGFGPRVWLQVQWAGCEKSRWCQNPVTVGVCLVCQILSENSLISVLHVFFFAPTFCRGAKHFYRWSVRGNIEGGW